MSLLPASIVGLLTGFYLLCVAGVAEARSENEQEDDDRGLVQELRDLPGDFAESLVGVLTDGFNAVSESIINSLTLLIVNYPTTHPNQHVAELHQTAFRLALLLSGLTLIVIGLLYLTNFTIGNLNPTTAAALFPKLLAALAIGAVAPHLIQYLVELFQLLTVVFQPDAGLRGALRMTGGLAVVAVINALGLLAVAIFFIVRNVFILFYAAFAPIIFLMAVTPYLRGYAAMMSGAFVGFIIVGPVEMALFNLTVSFVDTLTGVPQWLGALGGIILLMVVPYFFVTIGAQAAAQAVSPLPKVNVYNTGNNRRGGDPPSRDHRPPPRGRYR